MAKDHGLKQVACPYCKTVFWCPRETTVPLTALQQRVLAIVSRLATHESIINDALDRLWATGTDALIAQIRACYGDEITDAQLAAVRNDLLGKMPPRTDPLPAAPPSAGETRTT